YNIDIFEPQSDYPYTSDGSVNWAHLLVGSEGTLAWTRSLTLKLGPLRAHRALGVVSFSTLSRPLQCPQHLVALQPSAVQLVDRLTQIFAKHGTRGTWYAHASVGTLHVRPILDMRRDGATKMRAIAEEASAMVREYKGAYSGEHGDGLVRSEWVAWQFGPQLT